MMIFIDAEETEIIIEGSFYLEIGCLFLLYGWFLTNLVGLLYYQFRKKDNGIKLRILERLESL